MDIGISPFIDRIGYRPLVVAVHILAVLGFVLFAITPLLSINPYMGFIVATVVFSSGGGLLEVIVSPIVNALPSKEKSASMSLLHSFYSWGQVSVALITTLIIFVFGRGAWPYGYLFWALVPFVNIMLLLKCPLVQGVPEKSRIRPVTVLKNPRFAIFFVLIICAGASELTLGQWTSAFMEDAMGLPKIVGDIAGMCMFAVMMGTARTLNGIKGTEAGLKKLMLAGGTLAFFCYLIVSFTNSPYLGLAACALCGLGVSLLWPGTLSIAAKTFPMAGTWLFAILAAGGDTGASLGPWLAGVIGDASGSGLRASMLAGSIFPLMVVALVIVVWRFESKGS